MRDERPTVGAPTARRPAPTDRLDPRVAPAQWAPPFDDRPSPRAMALAFALLGLAFVASMAFFGWAVTVERDPHRAPVDAPATAEPSVTTRRETTRRGEQVGAFVLGPDGATQSGWPFDEGIADTLDDAAGDCWPEPREGTVVRLIARDERITGHVEGSVRILAAEIQPPGGRPSRLYGFPGHDGHHVYDEAGARSCGAGWRPPLADLRRTSRFNPKRLHPILHRLMPHQGTDFGAPKGTPVYASYRGVVDWVGPHGAHGNWVSVIHPDGIETGYAHLSKFAPGIKHGDHVHAHQLLGYVGSTGRSTGPHLHWSARKDGEWFDAESLLTKSSHGVLETERAAFMAVKAEMDRRLDAIPMPSPTLPAHRPAGGSLVPEAPAPIPRVELSPDR